MQTGFTDSPRADTVLQWGQLISPMENLWPISLITRSASLLAYARIADHLEARMGLQFTAEHARQRFRRRLTHGKRPSAKNGQRLAPSYATGAGEYFPIQRSSGVRSVVNITGIIGIKPNQADWQGKRLSGSAHRVLPTRLQAQGIAKSTSSKTRCVNTVYQRRTTTDSGGNWRHKGFAATTPGLKSFLGLMQASTTRFPLAGAEAAPTSTTASGVTGTSMPSKTTLPMVNSLTFANASRADSRDQSCISRWCAAGDELDLCKDSQPNGGCERKGHASRAALSLPGMNAGVSRRN